MWKRNKGKRNVLIFLLLIAIISVLIIISPKQESKIIIPPEDPKIVAKRKNLPPVHNNTLGSSISSVMTEQKTSTQTESSISAQNKQKGWSGPFRNSEKIDSNAFYILQDAIKLLPPLLLPKEGKDRYESLEGSIAFSLKIMRPDNDPELLEYLELKTQPAINKMREALNYSHYLYPEIQDYRADRGNLPKYRTIARIMYARIALIISNNGDPDEALSYVWDTLEFGQVISSDGFLIDYLVGVAIQHMALQSLDDIVKHYPTHESLNQVPKILNFFRLKQPSLKRIIDYEIRSHVSMLSGNKGSEETAEWLNVFDYEPKGTMYYFLSSFPPTRSAQVAYRHAKVKTRFEESKRLMIDNWDLILEKMSLPFLESLEWEKRNPQLTQAMDNDFLFSHIYHSNISSSKIEAAYLGAIIIIALEKYRYQDGKYPENLGDLIPEFITELSKDPFSGNDFKYRVEDDDYLLYSVYRDQRDSGGKKMQHDDYMIHAPPGWR